MEIIERYEDLKEQIELSNTEIIRGLSLKINYQKYMDLVIA